MVFRLWNEKKKISWIVYACVLPGPAGGKAFHFFFISPFIYFFTFTFLLARFKKKIFYLFFNSFFLTLLPYGIHSNNIPSLFPQLHQAYLFLAVSIFTQFRLISCIISSHFYFLITFFFYYKLLF